MNRSRAERKGGVCPVRGGRGRKEWDARLTLPRRQPNMLVCVADCGRGAAAFLLCFAGRSAARRLFLLAARGRVGGVFGMGSSRSRARVRGTANGGVRSGSADHGWGAHGAVVTLTGPGDQASPGAVSKNAYCASVRRSCPFVADGLVSPRYLWSTSLQPPVRRGLLYRVHHDRPCT